ncbi:unnamed protein product (macronuclear) [Paramecium tetraurelia]|uniref:Uncharacterized protein n=1 Tax=Paramecium tetraurelia TaxID=5888 RepID=A0BGV2_PARTE|nr:uncharacterized protein GSPATT00028804001 [Paramecium tetraurelia]CAK57769.1 unnamed protein product [Paramecium tetraurelia]|eukprot:XP_001425167.1 hypothetical protein (macronuclear) [Paramecium tetraurelia strain d4-2]
MESKFKLYRDKDHRMKLLISIIFLYNPAQNLKVYKLNENNGQQQKDSNGKEQN